VKLNAAALLTAVRATTQPRSAGSAAARRRNAIAERSKQQRAHWEQRAAEARTAPTLSATTLAAELAEVMPEDAVFCDETVSNRQPFVNLIGFKSPLSYWSGKGGGLGFSLPGALGMSLAQPRRTIVNAIGDGALMYYPQTLWTAANLGLGSVVVLVLNNTSYRVLKLGVQRMGGPWASTGVYPPGLDIEGPTLDVVAMARAMGVEAERVSQPSQLRPALERAFSAGRPYVLDTLIEKSV
ncbi:MAG: thiamine pyrophosphate-dependent enzyme, partial [Chloroflexota bacterium]|nr:thiamine pyrophosphate-dependent enzyme [Chloroflexota bacterium]